MCQPDDRHRDRSMRRWNKATINREEEEETGGGGGGGGRDCEKRTGSLAGWARRYRSSVLPRRESRVNYTGTWLMASWYVSLFS